MAFKKSTSLPTGVSAEYFRLIGFRWDRAGREASAQFALYLDAATAVAGQPLVPIAAKLRLSGDDFDRFLGPAALAAADSDVIAQLYKAARGACQDFATRADVTPSWQLVSDFGPSLFADAEEV